MGFSSLDIGLGHGVGNGGWWCQHREMERGDGALRGGRSVAAGNGTSLTVGGRCLHHRTLKERQMLTVTEVSVRLPDGRKGKAA